MTKAELKRLNTICAKVESLQHSCSARQDKDDLESAKKFLMYALRRNEA